MQKIKKLLFISMISFLLCRVNATPQGLGCEATTIMAGVVAAGMAYRTAYSALCLAVSPFNITYSHGYPTFNNGNRTPSDFALDLVYKGFYPALVAGTLTAAAARSGSLPQLSMKDVIKPAAWGFGTLFVAHIPFVARAGWSLWKIDELKKNWDNGGRDQSHTYDDIKNDAIDWERCALGYAQNAVVVGIPLYVLYQRYNQKG